MKLYISFHFLSLFRPASQVSVAETSGLNVTVNAKQDVQEVTLLTCIRKVPASNLGSDTEYPD